MCPNKRSSKQEALFPPQLVSMWFFFCKVSDKTCFQVCTYPPFSVLLPSFFPFSQIIHVNLASLQTRKWMTSDWAYCMCVSLSKLAQGRSVMSLVTLHHCKQWWAWWFWTRSRLCLHVLDQLAEPRCNFSSSPINLCKFWQYALSST